MIDPTCQNCGSNEHFSKDINAGTGAWSPSILPIGFTRDARYQIVVCGSCGLTRWFVPKEFLGDVREKFERVSPPVE